MDNASSVPWVGPDPTTSSTTAPSAPEDNKEEALARAKALRQAVSSYSTPVEPQLTLPYTQYLPSRPYIPICRYGTRSACPSSSTTGCTEVHFERALRPHTEVSLGDCSYLNTCHRMESCRYVHWVLEDPGKGGGEGTTREVRKDDDEVS
jgi:hypothetical protein